MTRCSPGTPTGSAEDGWIVFSTYPLRDFQCCEVSNLYRVRPDGSELEQLTFFETDAERATQPRVTPDGASILYTAVSIDRRVPALVPLNGGDSILIVEGGIYTHPVRQPGNCPDDVGCGTSPYPTPARLDVLVEEDRVAVRDR